MTAELGQRLRQGDRRALARAITWCESTLPEHRNEAESLLSELLPFSGGAHRVALTGPPGAGKSTLVDALGAAILALGGRVAVLAVDPSSPVTGGSLLGDAIRMPRLAASDQVFLRSSSNAGMAGGVGRGTREAICLCEAAGFDWVVIETVGVGQAEHAVAELCDTLVAVTLAGGGDEIQGMKRGLFELCDAVVVGKADGAFEAAALAHAHELRGAFALLRPERPPYVSELSAKSGRGVEQLRNWLSERYAALRASGELVQRRARQLVLAFEAATSSELLLHSARDPRTTELLPRLEAQVAAGELLPTAAARQLVRALFDARS